MKRSLALKSLLAVALLSLCAAFTQTLAADAKDLFAQDLSDSVGGEHWKWENGELVAKDHETLWTKESYAKFVLDLDFKVAKESNSGVFLRSGNIKDVLGALEIQVHENADGSKINFSGLMALVAQAQPGMRIRFATSHPKDMTDDILETIAAYPNICNNIHLPVQSGSSRILKLMNRKYDRQWYLERIAAIRRILPECSITTDVFCGFHSETPEDHELTLSLMREVGYDSAFLFKYSERPGTFAAEKLPDTVSEEIKIQRLNELIALQNELSGVSNHKDIGKTFEVLVEGFSKRSREKLFGRTQQNKVVVFPKEDAHIGQFRLVKVTSSTSATLLGELI